MSVPGFRFVLIQPIQPDRHDHVRLLPI